MIPLLISYSKQAVLSVSLNTFILVWMLQKKYFMKVKCWMLIS